MPASKKELKLSMRIRIFVSGLVCVMMASVLVAAAFPSGIRLTALEKGRPAGQASFKAADARAVLR